MAVAVGSLAPLLPAPAEAAPVARDVATTLDVRAPPPTAVASDHGLDSLAAGPTALNQAFADARHDYVVRCPTGQETTLTGTVEAGSTVRAVPLGPGATTPTTLASTFSYRFTAPSVVAVRFEVAASATPTVPTASYRVRCLPNGFPNLTSTVSGTPQAAYYVVTHTNWDILLDATGTPVWWFREPHGLPVDAKILRGQMVTTVPGDNYHFREWDGTITRAVPDLDHHDLQYMPNGDLVGFQYYNSTRGLTEEARFVRLGPDGEERWVWRTEDHLAPEESPPAIYKMGVWGHPNSVEPDGEDRLLVSIRNLDAIHMIDMVTGEVVWKLGGTRTPASLTVSNGARDLTDEEVLYLLSGQHDARLYPDGSVSVFDNGTGPTQPNGGLVNRRPRQLRFALDLPNRRATLVETITDPRAGWSFGLGSGRRTARGNWVVNWGGSNTFFAEYTPAGVPVLTVEGISTYRAVPVEPGEIDDDAVREGMDAMAGTPSGVTGAVTDAATGAPVPWAGVTLLRADDLSLAGGTVADEAGNFSAAVPPGSYYLYMLDSSGDHRAGFLGAPLTVRVTARGRPDVEGALAPARGAISGTVTDQQTGGPVTGAWALTLDDATGAPGAGASADGTGHFTIPRLAAGRYRLVFIDPAAGHGTRFFPNSLDAPSATPLTVVAGGATTANGTLPAQAPPPGSASLGGTVTETGSGRTLGGLLVLALRASDFALVATSRTNAGGAYAMSVAAGPYKLVFLDPSGRHATEWHDDRPYHGLGQAASVTAPAITDAALDATTGGLSGRVTASPGGGPVAGSWVIAIGPTGPAGGAITAADGTYAVSGLPPGTYRVAFIDPTGAHRLEYADGSGDYAGATPVGVVAGQTRSIDATLDPP